MKRLETEIENPRWRAWTEIHPGPSRRYSSDLVTRYGSDIEAMKRAIDYEFPDRQTKQEIERREGDTGTLFRERTSVSRKRRYAHEREDESQARPENGASEQVVAEFLRGLPEFHASTDVRIRRLTREIIKLRGLSSARHR